MIAALIFDVDGTLAETEGLHLSAFNTAFAEEGLNWHWDAALYRDLLKVTGGKERMRAYAERIGVEVDDVQLARLHARKNVIYAQESAAGALALRSGIRDLARAAHGAGLRLAIATTTSLSNVEALLGAHFGAAWRDLFPVVAAGDMVGAKKPAPDIYQLALAELALAPCAAIAIEDSRNGVAAAKGAGLRVIGVRSEWLPEDDLSGADLVLPTTEALDLRRVWSLAG